MTRWIGVVVLLLVLTIACDPSAGVTLDNRMDTEIRLYHTADPNEEAATTLGPGRVTRVGFGKDFWTGLLIGRDPSGEIVFEVTLTWEEFKELERLVIE